MNNSMENQSPDCGNDLNDLTCSRRLNRKGCIRGFTLIELCIVVAIIGTLSAIAIPTYLKYKYEAMVTVAITDVRLIEKQITDFVINNDQLPNNLNVVPNIPTTDPWGNPYQYLRIDGGPPGSMGLRRKDHFMVPVNSDYDLYSMGADGNSQAPFTAPVSQDDIVRANDGGYVGLVSSY
jgi:general secretion pathway protein G